MSRKTNQLYYTAIHEAGHAVVTWQLGLQVTKITIRPDNQEGTFGSCQNKPIGKWFQPDVGVLLVDDSHWRMLRRAINEATIFLAGMEAEARVRGRRNLTGASSDMRNATELCQYFADDYGPETNAMAEWLRIRARGIVNRNWESVEALANALLELKTLKGKEALRIMAVAIDEAHPFKRYVGAKYPSEGDP